MSEEISIIQPEPQIKIISLNQNAVEWTPSTKEKKTEAVVPFGINFFEISVVNIKRGNIIFNGGKFGFELNLKKDHKYSIGFKDIVSYLEIELLVIDITSGSGKIIRAKQTDTSDLWNITY